MSKSSTLTTSRNELKNSASSSEPWLKRLKPSTLVFDDSNSNRTIDHHAETSATVIEKNDLEETISEMTDRKAEIDKKAESAKEEIDPIRIDLPFVGTTTVRPIEATTTVPKVIAPLIEAPATDLHTEATTVETGRLTVATAIDHKATDLLTEATTAAIAHLIEVAAVTDQVAVVDSDPAVAADVPAAVVDSDPAAAVVALAAVDSDPAVAAEGPLAETNPKATKPKLTKPKATKPKSAEAKPKQI